MLHVIVQKLGNVTVFRCVGRLVLGDENTILRRTVLSYTGASSVVLDLAQLDDIDAGGLGMLMNLRELTRKKGFEFKLMNATKRVQQILELTNLDRVFDTCTVEEIVYRSRLHGARSLWRDRAA
jgi:anti-anti-sigma factor